MNMIKAYNQGDSIDKLLNKFNNRDTYAFSQIYSLLYKELYYFSNSLYRGSIIDSEDIIQDLFFNIWEDRNRKFSSISHLRAFMFVVIKNGYKRHYNHIKFIEKAKKDIFKNEDYFIYRATEAELFSTLPEILNMLPTECARSLKLLLEGYDIKEVAQTLGKQPSTIYNQRKESISILKKRLSSDKLLVLCVILKYIG